jgi:hypothetical protein
MITPLYNCNPNWWKSTSADAFCNAVCNDSATTSGYTVRKRRRVKMFVTWRDYTVKQEQHLDHLRQAEKRRLIKQVTADCEESGTWQAVKGLVLGITKRQPVRDQVPCGEPARLAKEAV